MKAKFQTLKPFAIIYLPILVITFLVGSTNVIEVMIGLIVYVITLMIVFTIALYTDRTLNSRFSNISLGIILTSITGIILGFMTFPIQEKINFDKATKLISVINNYKLPKLDYFYSVGKGETYEEKCENFYTLVRSWQPGLIEIIFHPSEDTENLKTITNSWQQRVWEAQMFADPKVQQFLKDEDIIFTNWKEIMQRFNEKM